MKNVDGTHLLLAAICLLVATAVISPAVGGQPDPPEEPFDEEPETKIIIEVHENGSATWWFVIRSDLPEDLSDDDYDALRNHANETANRTLDTYRSQMTRAVTVAENETGRNMSVTGFEASTSIESNEYEPTALITYHFQWHGFARETDYGLQVGDALTGQLTIDDDEELIIVGPENMTANAPVPESEYTPDERRVIYDGPVKFDKNEPSVQFVPLNYTDDEQTDMQPLVQLGIIATVVSIGITLVAAAFVLLFTGDSGDEN